MSIGWIWLCWYLVGLAVSLTVIWRSCRQNKTRWWEELVYPEQLVALFLAIPLFWPLAGLLVLLTWDMTGSARRSREMDLFWRYVNEGMPAEHVWEVAGAQIKREAVEPIRKAEQAITTMQEVPRWLTAWFWLKARWAAVTAGIVGLLCGGKMPKPAEASVTQVWTTASTTTADGDRLQVTRTEFLPTNKSRWDLSVTRQLDKSPWSAGLMYRTMSDGQQWAGLLCTGTLKHEQASLGLTARYLAGIGNKSPPDQVTLIAWPQVSCTKDVTLGYQFFQNWSEGDPSLQYGPTLAWQTTRTTRLTIWWHLESPNRGDAFLYLGLTL